MSAKKPLRTTFAHTVAELAQAQPPEGPSWTLVDPVMEPSLAFDLISHGSDWIFHRCGAGLLRSDHMDALDWLEYARRECIPESERACLLDRGKRKHVMPTVVLAEHWSSDDGGELIVFREDGPYVTDRTDPY